MQMKFTSKLFLPSFVTNCVQKIESGSYFLTNKRTNPFFAKKTWWTAFIAFKLLILFLNAFKNFFFCFQIVDFLLNALWCNSINLELILNWNNNNIDLSNNELQRGLKTLLHIWFYILKFFAPFDFTQIVVQLTFPKSRLKPTCLLLGKI